MTKEEFLGMINTELDNLEKELKEISSKIEYLKAVGQDGEEYEKLLHQKKLIASKINQVAAVVRIPAYERIQAMSDLEIEESKKEEIELVELNIKNLELEEKEALKKVESLKNEQNDIMVGFSVLSEEGKTMAVSRGKEIVEELKEYDESNPNSIISTIRKEKNELLAKKNRIKKMSSEAFKDKLSSKIDQDKKLEGVSKRSKELNPLTKLLASIAQDPEKVKIAADLLSSFNTISKMSINLNFPAGKIDLPDDLQSRLTYVQTGYKNFTYINNVNYVEQLLAVIDEFYSRFKAQREEFDRLYDMDNVYHLGKVRMSNNPFDEGEYGFDLEFLERNKDKLNPNLYELLLIGVAKKEKLEKRLIKTKSTKIEISELERNTKHDSDKLYDEIKKYYFGFAKDNKELFGDIHISFDLRSLEDDVTLARRRVENYDKAIQLYREKILKYKEELEIKIKDKQERKDKILDRLMELGNNKEKISDIPTLEANVTLDRHADNIIYAAADSYVDDLVTKVREEAQNQSLIEEAKLRGVSLEELAEIKAQENKTEEASTGMRK